MVIQSLWLKKYKLNTWLNLTKFLDFIFAYHIYSMELRWLQNGETILIWLFSHFDSGKGKKYQTLGPIFHFLKIKKLHTSSAAWNSDRLMRRSCRIRFSCITRSITCNQGGKSWYTSKINASSKLFSDPNFLCITSIRISRTSEYYLPQDRTRKISSNQTAQYFYYMTF